MVQTDAEGYKAVDYSRMVPVMVEALKEQQLIIAKQDEKIHSLEKKLSEIEQLLHTIQQQ